MRPEPSPPIPTGSDRFAAWARWVHDRLTKSLVFNDSPTVKVSRTANGIRFDAAGGSSAPAPAATPVSVSVFYFDSMFKDYIVCTRQPFTIGPGPTPADFVRVAKPYKLRNSILSVLIDGKTINYTYPNNPAGNNPPTSADAYRTRTATINNVPIQQVIVPRYLKYITGSSTIRDPIVAITAATGIVTEAADTGVAVGTPVTLLDLNNDARAWSASFSQT